MLTVVNLNMVWRFKPHGISHQVYWEMVTDVLQEDATSIFRAVTLPGLLQKFLQQMSPKCQLRIHQSTWHHIPEDLNLHQHCCKNLNLPSNDFSRYFTVEQHRLHKGGIPVTHALWPYLIICAGLLLMHSAVQHLQWSVAPCSQRCHKSHLTSAHVGHILW